MRNWINIALPKGRLGEKAYDIFEAIGYGCPSIHEGGRKLIFENEENGVRYFWVNPQMWRFMWNAARRISVWLGRIFFWSSPRMCMNSWI